MTVTNARSVFNFNCKFVEPDNGNVHRVAASDVDFRFDPDGNSGALYCYAVYSGGEVAGKKRLAVVDWRP